MYPYDTFLWIKEKKEKYQYCFLKKKTNNKKSFLEMQVLEQYSE